MSTYFRISKKDRNALHTLSNNLKALVSSADSGNDFDRDSAENIAKSLLAITKRAKEFKNGEKPTGLYESINNVLGEASQNDLELEFLD